MMCAICREHAARTGLLCDGCRNEVIGEHQVSIDQIAMIGREPTSAALVDVWGQPHRLDPTTPVGRHIEDYGLALFDGSVSRHHATIVRELDHWTIADRNSTNGTYLDDVAVTTPQRLGRGARVRFGQVAFYFLDDTADVRPTRSPRASSPTLGLPDDLATRRSTRPLLTAIPDDDHVPGTRTMTFQVFEPAGGGGALIEIDGKLVQLTLPQYELVRALVARMQDDMERPLEDRGFVASSELLRDISWDTPDPDDDHLSQLVRRLRRGLVRAGLEDLIESRPGSGYRLRVLLLRR